jgi:transposase
MYGVMERRQALELQAQGLSMAAVSRQLGISREAVARWITDPVPALVPRPGCFLREGDECPDAAS